MLYYYLQILYFHVTWTHHHDRYRNHHETYDLCQLDVNQHHVRKPLRILNAHHKRRYGVAHNSENKKSKIHKPKKRKNLIMKSDNLDKRFESKRKPWFHRSTGKRRRNRKVKKTTSWATFITTSLTGDTQTHFYTETSIKESSSDRSPMEGTERSSTQSTTEMIRLFKSIYERPNTERSPHQYLAPDVSVEWYS